MVARTQQTNTVDAIFRGPNKIHDATHEDVDRLQHVEDLLHKWIQAQPHLPSNYDSAMMRNFVRGAKYNLDTAKKKVSGYFRMKREFPELFAERNPEGEDVEGAFEATNIVFLPRLTEDEERIMVLSLDDLDAAKLDIGAATKLYFMIYDLLLTATIRAKCEIVIFDAAGFTGAHAAKFVSAALKNALKALRVGYAMSIKQIHVVNASGLVETVIKALKPFMHEKLRDRFIVHKKSDSVKDYIDLKVLPKDYGGAQAALREKKAEWRQVLRDNKQWFEAQEKVQMIGEAPKKNGEATHDDFGVEGTFRKLNLD